MPPHSGIRIVLGPIFRGGETGSRLACPRGFGDALKQWAGGRLD